MASCRFRSRVNILTGGNPTLQPEEADTLTIGAVWQPSFINNLTLTFDYYDIKIEDAVSTQSTTDVLNGCYTTAFNPSLTLNAQCALIGRNPNNGTLNGVESPGIALVSSNLGKQRVAGCDFTAAYMMNLVDFGLSDNWGKLNLSFSANLVDINEFQATPTSINRDCNGFYSVACLQPNFELKTTSRATWNLGDIGFSLQWRYQDEVIEERGGTVFPAAAASIDAYNYFDLTGRWDVNHAVRLNVTVSNLTDEQPPAPGIGVGNTTFNNGNTFPQTYDTLGRYYTGGLTLRF